MAIEKCRAPDFWKIGFKTLTPVSLLREKHRLLQVVIAMRKRARLTQAQLGRMADISQSRMAQIEAGIAKGPVSFDLIFLLLEVLGQDIHVITRPKRVLKRPYKRGKR